MAKMTFTKWLKQAKANTKIIERLEQIKYDYEQGKDLSYDDLAFLQSQQDFIKKEFCDDIVLWQIAGIDESDWNSAHKGATMIKKMKYINWDSKIFFGFYESILYSSDTLYNMSCDNELKDDEFYDFYDDEQGNYTYGQYEQAVAKDCVNALFANLVQGSNDIIKDMQFVALHSPRFYNFETDKLEMEITVGWDKLLIWVQENRDKFNQYLHDEFTSCSGFTSFIPNNYNEFFDCLQDDFERLSQVMIEFYILQNLDYDSYYQDCAEIADEQIWNYVKIQKQ